MISIRWKEIARLNIPRIKINIKLIILNLVNSLLLVFTQIIQPVVITLVLCPHMICMNHCWAFNHHLLPHHPDQIQEEDPGDDLGIFPGLKPEEDLGEGLGEGLEGRPRGKA